MWARREPAPEKKPFVSMVKQRRVWAAAVITRRPTG